MSYSVLHCPAGIIKYIRKKVGGVCEQQEAKLDCVTGRLRDVAVKNYTEGKM